MLWKHLKHQNITPLLLLLKYMQHQIISPIPYPIINVNFLLPLKNDWTLPEYIEEHPEADRVALVGIYFIMFTLHSSSHQLSDVARGLNYLHSYDVVHTELKGVRSSCSSYITVLNLAQEKCSYGWSQLRKSYQLWPCFNQSTCPSHRRPGLG